MSAGEAPIAKQRRRIERRVSIPGHPKIYHIVHVDALASIVSDGALLADSVVRRRSDATMIGMRRIKDRRLVLPVSCHPELRVGDCVPFYFCPRSIMLFVIHRANHEDLTYRGGQVPIVHLEADLYDVVRWADSNARRWAFTTSNAGSAYAQFHARLDQLGEIDWSSVASTYFVQPDVKEAKQAEFLIESPFPWTLVERIGVASHAMVACTEGAVRSSDHRPPIQVRSEWYYA